MWVGQLGSGDGLVSRYDPGLDRADHDRHPSFISDALGVSTRKVKTITEELCGRTF